MAEVTRAQSLIADGLSLIVRTGFGGFSDRQSAISDFSFQQQPSSPVIVKIITPPHDPTGISDVIIGAIGLTGFIVVLAIVLGLLMAGILFWFRSRNPLSH